MRNKVRVYKNSNGDSRTAPKDVSFDDFKEANRMHIQDVKSIMNEVGYKLMKIGHIHDFTKITDEEMFYDNFISAMNKGTDFVNDEWYQMHVKEERHHLLSNCPSDVNLLDVIEMIVDCVAAGKARAGEVRPIEIDKSILEKALENTVEMISKMVEAH